MSDLKVAKYTLCSLLAAACICVSVRELAGPKRLSGGWFPRVGHQESAPVGGVLGSSRFLGEGVIPDQRLPLAISTGLFFLVVLVMRGSLGGIFGGHVDECG